MVSPLASIACRSIFCAARPFSWFCKYRPLSSWCWLCIFRRRSTSILRLFLISSIWRFIISLTNSMRKNPDGSRSFLGTNWLLNEISVSSDVLSSCVFRRISEEGISSIFGLVSGATELLDAIDAIGEKSIAHATSYVRKVTTTLIAITFIHFLFCQSNIGLAPFKKNNRAAALIGPFSATRLSLSGSVVLRAMITHGLLLSERF